MNRKIFFVVLILAGVSICLEVRDGVFGLEELVEVLSHVPENKKYDFVRRHLLQGRELSEQYVRLEDTEGDQRLSLAIYNLLLEEKVEKELLLRRNHICFPAPIGCINPNDAGIRPT